MKFYFYRNCLIILGMIALLPLPATSQAGRLKLSKIRKLLGIRAGVRLTKGNLKRALKKRFNRRRFYRVDKRGRINISKLKKSKRVVLPLKIKQKKRQPRLNDRAYFTRLGRIKNKRITKKTFKYMGMYHLLDVTRRGYVTLDDVRKFRALGRERKSRYRAARFIRLFDRNRDWKLAWSEFKRKDRGRVFRMFDKNKDKSLSIQELALGIAKRKAARRKARRRGK